MNRATPAIPPPPPTGHFTPCPTCWGLGSQSQDTRDGEVESACPECSGARDVWVAAPATEHDTLRPSGVVSTVPCGPPDFDDCPRCGCVTHRPCEECAGVMAS